MSESMARLTFLLLCAVAISVKSSPVGVLFKDDTNGNQCQLTINTAGKLVSDCDIVTDTMPSLADFVAKVNSDMTDLKANVTELRNMIVPSSCVGLPNGPVKLTSGMTYCENGWALLLKSNGGKELQYSSPYWTNDLTLNQQDTTKDNTDAKFQAFNLMDVSYLRATFPSKGEAYTFESGNLGVSKTAREIFAGAEIISPLSYDTQFPSGWSTQPNCKKFGVNVDDNYRGARFGFQANQENNCDSHDTAAGIGLYSTSTESERWGAGDMCRSSNCNNGMTLNYYQGLLWGRPAGIGMPTSCDGLPTGVQELESGKTFCKDGWALLLKTTGGKELQYSSAFWTNENLLNKEDMNEGDSDAKLGAFLNMKVRELKATFPSKGDSYSFESGDLGVPKTARDIFAGGEIISPLSYDTEFPSGWSTQPNCKKFGVNVDDNYRGARFGFQANQENNCDSHDTAAGIGLYSTSTESERWGAGDMCRSSNCNNGMTLNYYQGLLWGR